MTAFVVKAEIEDPDAESFVFTAQKTMYGGKHIGVGDTVYVFMRQAAGRDGLVARGVVTAAEGVAPSPGRVRQTPRVSVTVKRSGHATRALGRVHLKPFNAWDDGRPETELNFKLYRQATDKIVGVTAATAVFLDHYVAPVGS
jgi:hypothetical protein